MSDKLLNIKGLGNIVDKTYYNDKDATDALYELFKKNYTLSYSKSFRGTTADKVKTYLQDGPITCIKGLMNVSNELVMIAQYITLTLNNYETSEKGVISGGVLDYAKNQLRSKANTIKGMTSPINGLLNKAANYIEVKPLSMPLLTDEFEQALGRVDKISNTIENLDADLSKAVGELYSRCENIEKMISGLRQYCYGGGSFSPENAAKISKQTWYMDEGNVALQIKMQEDPFLYKSDKVSVSEDQWAKGLCQDVYAYAGYNFLNGEYAVGLENGKFFANAAASLLTANAYLQVTDYVRAKGDVKVAYAEGSVSAGLSKEYVGYRVEGEAGLFSAEGSAILGTDDFNAYVKGKVEVCTVEGKIAREFEDDGEFAIGIKGSATLAKVSGKAGFSFFKVDIKDVPGQPPVKMGLLSFSIEPKAGGSAGAGVWLESQTAIEGKYVNINAVTLELDLEFLIGGEVNITLPKLHIKPPWKW